MSDSVTGVSVHTEAQETAGGRTAGTLLREARMEAGLHIAALAVALKVPVAKLEALESDNFAVLPDTVFVRALASSVCRTLKIDPAPILALLPQSKSPRLVAGNAGINAPVKGSSSSAGNGSFAPASSGGKKSWAIAVVVLALLAGALAIMFVPADRNPFGGSAGDEAPASPPVAAQEPQAPVAVASGPAAVPAPAAAVVAAPAATPAAPVPAASPSAAAVAGAATPAVAASTPEAAASASSVLTLSARGASWVQVRDAGGTIALQKNLAVGESVAVSGTLPLAVVIGRADVTDVFVRGKPFALTTVSRDNVARFEVK
ncbi:helix-turn-helix domain-containing protein [Acidovorax sp. A1169]|uniref:helix-turn-helix domain-containing protein n=1 Tax=Acidovorax sp. A1169 TaxID=3059524 RepID=UPI0027378F5A|nr:helix-turn-helix domain-containing protein [Acidovorax sp. A1169]MDP4077327.1 helix-turn-helix domain-containing protein [Acidovorax sp. A1169]